MAAKIGANETVTQVLHTYVRPVCYEGEGRWWFLQRLLFRLPLA